MRRLRKAGRELLDELIIDHLRGFVDRRSRSSSPAPRQPLSPISSQWRLYLASTWIAEWRFVLWSGNSSQISSIIVGLFRYLEGARETPIANAAS